MRLRALLKISLMLATTLLVSACGGGGGGGTDPVTGTTPSGLVPTAPAPGATLRADATALRPLVPGAVWSYRAVLGLEATAQPGDWFNADVMHRSAAGGAVIESSPSYGEQTVSFRAGEVHTASTIPLPDGRVLPVDQLELRSPVRVDDQYTIFDQRIANSGVDLDGDAKNDSVDIGAYSRVIGEEFVDLQNYPQVRSVRVQTVLLTRFKLSKTDTFTDISSSTIDTWYADAIGIVMQRTDEPGSIPGGRSLTTQRLVNWDGVDRGIGFLPTQPAANPASNARLSHTVSVASFDTHALLLSYAASEPTGGIALSSINARGQVVSTKMFTGIDASRAQVFRVGDAARVVAMSSAGLQMYSFDASGNSTSASPLVLKAGVVAPMLFGVEFVGVSSGDVLWLAWAEPSGDPLSIESTLQAQPFDAAGHVLAPPVALSSSTCGSCSSSLQGASSSGNVIFTWHGVGQQYAFAKGVGATTLTVHTAVAAGGVDLQMQAAASTSGPALLWLTPLTTDPRVSGITFDPSGEPVRSNALALQTEELTIPWLTKLQYLRVSRSGRLDVFTQGFGKLWPQDVLESNVSTVTELLPGTGPLATQAQPRLLARGTQSTVASTVSLAGNVLLFADTDSGISVTSVWRRQ